MVWQRTTEEALRQASLAYGWRSCRTLGFTRKRPLATGIIQDSTSDHRGIPMAERRRRRLLQRLLSGSKNIRFAEAFGFRLSRIHGSHHIYVHPDIPELVNLQNVNGQAKPYQVQQLLRLIERYNLQMEE